MSATPALTRYVLDVDQYFRMAEAGVFPEGTHVELIEGDLLTMAPVGSRHAYAVQRLIRLLMPLEDRGIGTLWSQSTMTLSRISAPEPDIALLRLPVAQYRIRQPTPADVLLLIEVAESSLAYDAGLKLALYARHLIPEVWIVDIQGRRLTAHREPHGGVYSASCTLQPTEVAVPQGCAGAAIPWGEALGVGPDV